MKTKILIITGGTGGHLYPALAIAEAIAKRNVEVIFVTRKNPNDIEIIKRSGFKYYTIPASGFMTKNLRNKILSLFNLFLGTFVFLKIFWTIKPQFLIASGCYVSVVPLIWATIFKIQFYLLEQNVIPGRVVKYFSRYAKEIFLGFPLKRPIRGNTFYSGNPLREQIIEVAQNFNWDTRRLNKKTILILGGSQGTAFLNLVGLNLAAQLPQLHFILLTGKQHYNDLQCQSHIPNCELIDYTHNPEELYQRASVVITRAGAIALSEILVFGLPAIIIPYPFAADNHQEANAQFIAQNKAAVVLKQCAEHELSQFINNIKNILINLLSDEKKLCALSKNALKLANINATDIIVQRIIKSINKQFFNLLCSRR